MGAMRRAVAVACDETKLAPLVAEYNNMSEKVRDLTDSWMGAIRKGIGVTGNGRDAQRQKGKRKPIKRCRVQLTALPGALGAAAGGFGGAGKEAEEHFGAGVQDADEMEYSTWRMESLFNSVQEEAEATRSRVRSHPLLCS